MSKRIVVSKEWHANAMVAIKCHEKNSAFMTALEVFINTKLTPEQQADFNTELNEWVDEYTGAMQ